MTVHASQPPSAARRAILDLLKREGPLDATALAARLEVTPMAARQHLYALADEGLVAFTEEARPKGRPAKLWRAERPADALFADAHADLTVELIGNIREVFGDKGLDRLIAKRTVHQIADYRAAMDGARTLRERVKRLARLRSDAGYMADFDTDGDGFILVENHCPVCRAAQACAGLCRQELEVFRAALGDDVAIERTDHILAGARRCAYLVRERTATPRP
jgi:predicted ArsR family transcriptional regulator